MRGLEHIPGWFVFSFCSILIVLVLGLCFCLVDMHDDYNSTKKENRYYY